MLARDGARVKSPFDRLILRMATLDPESVLDEIAQGLVEELDAALARIWLLGSNEACRICSPMKAQRRESALHLVASAGLSTSTTGAHHRVELGSLKIGSIAEKRVPVCTNEALTDPRIPEKAWLAKERITSFAGYPLVFHEELLGVVAMFGRRALSEDELSRLEAFAAHAAVAIKNARLFDEVSKLSKKLEAENAYLQTELRATQGGEIIGGARSLVDALDKLDRVAKTDANVLLLGETGTGKELFARRLHERSARRDGPLVKVNCASMSPALIESELFGHEKGAFTGATSRHLGRFELAHGGTLFLDEIGEMPLEAQAKLLRAVETREFERVGGNAPVRVNVRIVAATNRDLERAVKAETFRADLFYRLDVFSISLPPLRERRDDIALIASAFAEAFATRFARSPVTFGEAAAEALLEYDWPGNVRELQNVIERAVILANGDTIELEDLPPLVPAKTSAPAPDTLTEILGSDVHSFRERVSTYERKLLEDALTRASGNQSEAARSLGLSRATLQYKMRVHGLLG